MKNSISCIIPFYNEGTSVLSVISEIKKVPLIDQIICVDDGSTDDAGVKIKQKFPQVTLITLRENGGKAAAVAAGLKRVHNDQVLLMDADWLHLDAREIEKALSIYLMRTDIDMLILKNTGSNSWIDEKLRKYIFLAGNRVLKKADLIAAMKLQPVGYQLEVAINKQCIDSHKKVAWIPTSAFNPHKMKKLGLVSGLIKDLTMELSIIRFCGVVTYLQQMFFFCREEIKV